jgi:PTH1 family peptidyl-tRNA hydrolase
VSPDVKVIVGLGNPGAQYARSRHNVGFMVLDRFAELQGIRFNQKRAKSLVARGQFDEVEIVLAKPRTYMNRSGAAVHGLLASYRVKPPGLLVVYDDFDLPLGTLRLRERGSAGTHNGMRSIVETLGTQNFPRLRIGIGPPQSASARDYVLDEFDAESWKAFEPIRDRAVQAVETFLRDGVTATMNRFNA